MWRQSSTAHKRPLAARPHLGVEGASHEEGEGNGSQEEGKQVRLHSALGMGIVTREWVGEKRIAEEGEMSQEEREVRISEHITPNRACTRCSIQISSVTAVCALDRPSHSVVHLTQSHSTMEDR